MTLFYPSFNNTKHYFWGRREGQGVGYFVEPTEKKKRSEKEEENKKSLPELFIFNFSLQKV